jgi:uncharacterized protein HemY
LRKLNETVHDHNLTDEEREILGFTMSEEEYLQFTSEDAALVDLFRLYLHREDWAKAKEYFKRIKNKEYQFEIYHMTIGDCFFSDEEMEWARKFSEYFRDALAPEFIRKEVESEE